MRLREESENYQRAWQEINAMNVSNNALQTRNSHLQTDVARLEAQVAESRARLQEIDTGILLVCVHTLCTREKKVNQRDANTDQLGQHKRSQKAGRCS